MGTLGHVSNIRTTRKRILLNKAFDLFTCIVHTVTASGGLGQLLGAYYGLS